MPGHLSASKVITLNPRNQNMSLSIISVNFAANPNKLKFEQASVLISSDLRGFPVHKQLSLTSA